MSTVIITSIVQVPDQGAWLIAGTVDAAPHLLKWVKPFDPNELLPATVAQAFIDDWARMDQFINYQIASRTRTVNVPYQAAPLSVVFGNKAACYALVGYDQVQITATISGVTVSKIVSQALLQSWAYAGYDAADRIARELANDYKLLGSWLGPFVATFTGVTTTTSSSTTTTTTTTTTTSTTTTTTTT